MRALLVLFLIIILKLGEGYGSNIYADYYGLIELGSLFGALVADKVLGLRRAIVLGSWLVSCGFILLALTQMQLIGLSLVILGSSLSTINLITLFSATPLTIRGSASSIYGLLNAGALMASPLCALLAGKWGWQIGFLCAGFAQLVINFTFMRGALWQETKESPLAFRTKAALGIGLMLGILFILVGIEKQQISLGLLPYLEILAFAAIVWSFWRSSQLSMRQMAVLGISVIGLTIFYAFEEQITNFAGQGGPTAGFAQGIFLAVNPLMVLVFETPIDSFYRRMKHPFFQLFLPFSIGAFACSLLYFGHLTAGVAALTVGLVSLGELLVGSAAYLRCLEVGGGGNSAKAAGLVSVVFCLATSVGAHWCKTLNTSAISMPQNALILLTLALLLGFACTCFKPLKN